MSTYWMEVAKKIQAIASAGLTYSEGKYDLERYEQLKELSYEMLSNYTECDMEIIRNLFDNEKGYITPKVEVRAVVFQDGKILMVQEEADGKWSIPGGWADIGYSPGEVAVKEVLEESGWIVEPVRLLGVLNKKEVHNRPLAFHEYKIFISCKITGGEAKIGIETKAVEFFDRNNIPELSQERVTNEQIKLMFEFLDKEDKDAIFD